MNFVFDLTSSLSGGEPHPAHALTSVHADLDRGIAHIDVDQSDIAHGRP